MGAVPGFCGANCHSSSCFVNFGTAPEGSGDSPKFTAILLKPAPFGTEVGFYSRFSTSNFLIGQRWVYLFLFKKTERKIR